MKQSIEVESMYQTGQVALAAETTPSNINLWAARGHLVLGKKDRSADGSGNVRLFSFETAMQTAVATELMKCGMSAPSAFKAARNFAHIGDKDRDPGRPYPETKGHTYFQVRGEHTEVVLINEETPALSAFSDLGLPSTIIDAGDVYDRVVATLGGDPQG